MINFTHYEKLINTLIEKCPEAEPIPYTEQHYLLVDFPYEIQQKTKENFWGRTCSRLSGKIENLKVRLKKLDPNYIDIPF